MVDDYAARVRGATDVLGKLFNDLVAQLDVEQGTGFDWWVGEADWKTRVLIADYLVQSVHGTSASLCSAALAAREHAQVRYSRQVRVKGAIESLRRRSVRASAEEFARAVFDAPGDRERDLRAATSAEHALFHLAQAFDRLAAVLVIVGGFRVANVETVDWKVVPKLLSEFGASEPPNKPRTEPGGSPGRALQVDLLEPLTRLGDYGPPDWLKWLRETRNAMTHRPPGTQWGILLKDRTIVHPLFQQPKWSTVQTMVYAARPGLNGALLQEDSVRTIDGLCDSTVELIRDLTSAAASCWERRRSEPTLIAQDGMQWRDVEPAKERLEFRGFNDGRMLNVPPGGDLHMNPTDARRLAAARIPDAARAKWFT
ncbi:hypothetical protein [Tsukamurella soli]|uniref:Uncharacterized protein n=1 Tax=Tsukamurella soli TaxID=644556 RepID=A0ABP8J7C6_9ACTN